MKPFLLPGCPEGKDDDEIPMTSLHQFDSGKVEVKMKVVGFGSADGLSYSQAEMHARRQMTSLIYYLQTRGYQGRVLNQHILASVSRNIGVRESRRLTNATPRPSFSTATADLWRPGSGALRKETMMLESGSRSEPCAGGRNRDA